MIFLKICHKIIGIILSFLPREYIQSIIQILVNSRLRSLDPADGLRFLFQLDSFLYGLEGQKAVEYNGGLHTKHRHTHYHDFFVNNIKKGEHVLDIGCGNGAVTYEIASRSGASVTGIDMNETNIAFAIKHFSHPCVEYKCGDATKDLPNDRFDVVILSNVLEHIGERVLFLKKIQNSICPKRMLIRVPLFEREWRVPLKKELGTEWRLDKTHETEYTLETFAAEMSDAGFEICHQGVRWGEIWAEAKSIP